MEEKKEGIKEDDKGKIRMGRLGAKKKDEKKKEIEVMGAILGKDEVQFYIKDRNFKEYGLDFDTKY